LGSPATGWGFMKNIRNIIEGFVNGVFYGIMPLIVFLLLTSKLPVAGLRSFVVLTGSMEPKIPVGSIVLVNTQKRSPIISPIPGPSLPIYRIGQVISFIRRNETVTHRIVSVKPNGSGVSYITRGDANNVDDIDPVQQADIIGNQFTQIETIGKFVLYLKTLPGFFLFIILPGLAYICIEIVNIIKDLEKEIERRYTAKQQPRKRFTNVPHILSSV
jgi:signal peptidase